jgi:hypothetical protein
MVADIERWTNLFRVRRVPRGRVKIDDCVVCGACANPLTDGFTDRFSPIGGIDCA